MTTSPSSVPSPSLAQHLLASGIPLTLLMDLHDPVGMRVALTAELIAGETTRLAAAPAVIDLTEREQSRTA